MKYFYWLFFIFLSSLPLFFAASLLFLKDPLVWPDEAIYLDTARTLSQTGRLATNIFGGAIPGLEQHAHWYPPSYFHLLAFWTNIFGQGIESIRFLSLLLSFFSLIIFFFIVKILFADERLALLGTVILASDFSFSRASRVARMDMFSFFLITLSLLLFFIAEKQKLSRKKNLFYLFTGIVCGLAVATHPLGFIAPTTIITYLLTKILYQIVCGRIQIGEALPKLTLRAFWFMGKQTTLSLILIIIPVFVALSFWFLSMKDSFDLFLTQYHLQFLRKAPQSPFIFEMWRSNHWWKLIFSLYGLTALILFFQLFVPNSNLDTALVPPPKSGAGIIFLGIIISTAAILWGKEMWYPLYFQPFIVLGLMAVFSSTKNRLNKIFFTSIILILVFANINLFLTLVKQLGADSYDYHQFSKAISDKLSQKAMIFLATIPDPYFDLKLQKNKSFQLYEFPTVPISDQAYQKLLDSVDYLILNMMPDKRVENYMKKYTDKKIEIGQSGQFSAIIFQLVPKNKRN